MSRDVRLQDLVGLWEVGGVRDPETGNRLQRRNLPFSLKGLAARGDKLRVFETSKPNILFAWDKSGRFWIQRKANGRVVIRARGELDAGPGSYDVLKVGPNTSGRQSVLWNSLRLTDPKHHIEWVQLPFDDTTFGDVQVPVVPQKLRSRKSVRVCQCGDKRCLTGIDSIPGWVSISIQTISERQLQSGAQRDLAAVELKRARMEAHWNCFSPPQQTMVLRIGQHHMHPYALKKFQQEKRVGGKPKFKFSSFVLHSANVIAAVKPEDHKYFHFFRGSCLPKLNYPPSLYRDNAAALENAFAPVDSAQQEAETIAANAISKLMDEIEFMKHTVQVPEPRVEPQRNDSVQNNQPHRAFFTEAYHCGQRYRHKHKKHCTMTYFFGLPNNFEDAVALVQALHEDLEEEHSVDNRSAPLTPFEQCLLAKSYVLPLCPTRLIGVAGCDSHCSFALLESAFSASTP